jgi:hypothetical protein
MAAAAPYLVNQTLEQPEPKFVPARNTSQAVALGEGVRRIRINLRGREGRPKHILLGTINRCEFRVVKPIPVRVEARGRTVIASWRQVDEFGTGKSTSLACDDLGHTIAELYVSLEREEARLGPDLAKVWGVLKQYVVKRPHESA